MFESLSNQKLIAAYKKAIDLKLDTDFIKLLEKEIKNRHIHITSENANDYSLNKGWRESHPVFL